jgi:hypothetical protein
MPAPAFTERLGEGDPYRQARDTDPGTERNPNGKLEAIRCRLIRRGT